MEPSSAQQFFLAKPSPLMEFPLSLPRLMNREFLARRQRELYAAANQAIEATGTLTDDQLSLLQWYPKILELILLRPKLKTDLQATIAVEAPYAAFNAIVADYNSPTAQILELSLLPRGEYVCKLLLWAGENRVRLRYPPNMYYPTLYGDFYWAHYFYARRQVDHFFEKLVKFNLDYQEVSASSALCLACLGHLTSFTPAHIEMISQEPSIAFQAAVLFRDKLPLGQVLFDAALNPQWAYHIMTALPGLPAELIESCMAALEFSPPWMLEYLVATHLFEKDQARARDLLTRSLQSEHSLCDDLRHSLLTLL